MNHWVKVSVKFKSNSEQCSEDDFTLTKNISAIILFSLHSLKRQYQKQNSEKNLYEFV